jgi:hypothetical protein
MTEYMLGVCVCVNGITTLLRRVALLGVSKTLKQ